jgi:putative holliday junction resolvase
MNEFHLPHTHPLHLKVILALDYGEKFIGVATYCVNRDPYPTPYGRIANKGPVAVSLELKSLIESEFIDMLVIGVPHLIDGKSTSSTQRAESFIKSMREQITLPIYEQDETLSTFEAESRMKNSPQYNFQVDLSQIDALAACVILEDFIRHSRHLSAL